VKAVVVLGEEKIRTVRRHLADDGIPTGEQHAIDAVRRNVRRYFTNVDDLPVIREIGPCRTNDIDGGDLHGSIIHGARRIRRTFQLAARLRTPIGAIKWKPAA